MFHLHVLCDDPRSPVAEVESFAGAYQLARLISLHCLSEVAVTVAGESKPAMIYHRGSALSESQAEYLELARLARAKARKTREPHLRDSFLSIAGEWDLLAKGMQGPGRSFSGTGAE